MSSLETCRRKLPLLAVSQAQKEITHSEALVKIDALMHAEAEAELSVPLVPTDEDIGKCWLVGNTGTGKWAGKSAQLAIWIGGGWRFCAAIEMMRVRLQISGTDQVRFNSGWVAAPSIANRVGGILIDQEPRQPLFHFWVISARRARSYFDDAYFNYH